jgi:hypothetical protein
VLGAIAQFEASLVAKLKAARDRSVRLMGTVGRSSLCKKDQSTMPIVAKWSSRSLLGSERNMI